VAALVAAGAYTAYHQFRHGTPPGFTWARSVDRAHLLGWLALALLAADGVLDLLARTAQPAPWRRRTNEE
jgi:hypothetical protein